MGRILWQLGCTILLAVTTTAQIIASNTSTEISSTSGTLQLQSSAGQNLSQLVPLTRDALMRNDAPLRASLYYTTPDTLTKLTNEAISYISCTPSDYPGNMDAFDVLQNAMGQRNLTAVIFYSTESNFCGYEGAPEPMQEFPIFSMSNRDESRTLLDNIRNLSVAEMYFVNISRLGGDPSSNNNNNSPGQQQQNPLGPSPSTAVAMIILYSITGIITALFLVIIITGAVRAHRHPDRYGPRDIIGRPRQSRARGLGRAILDTIPIVKFGEREPPKPTDVEMGSTSETRNAENSADSNAEAGGNENRDQGATETRDATATETPRDVATTEQEQQSGIAPAQPSTAAAAATAVNRTNDDGLGCSICTDDFEKGQDIRVLPCDHKFHPECVDPWLLNVSGTCPLCRVDLRPTTSHSSTDGIEDGDTLAPPLQPEAETSHRRRSMLRDVLSLRSRPDASAEERISALRRLREQRRNLSGDVAGSSSENGSTENVAAQRRSRRISVRLSDVFSSRTRRHGQDDASPATPPVAESSSTPQPTVPEVPDPVPANTNSTSNADSESSQRRS